MNITFGLIFIFFGVLGVAFPKAMFKLDLRHLYYKNAEPNGCGIVMTRFGGIIFIILGLVFCFSQETFILFFED